MNFRTWLEMSSLRDKLSPIPQDAEHHPEGDVFTHTRMVRQALPQALALLRQASENPGSALSNLSFDLTPEETNLLRAAAWMHDVGKVGSTTLNIGGHHTPHSKDLERYSSWGKWQAIGHEKAQHFKPQMRDLEETPWQDMWEKMSISDRTDLFFLIKHHMKFGLKTVRHWIDQDGKYKNVRRIKLLLVLMVMDWLGRGDGKLSHRQSAVDRIDWFEDMARAAATKAHKPQTAPAPNDPKAFLKAMQGKPEAVIKQAFKGKFGRELTPEDMTEDRRLGKSLAEVDPSFARPNARVTIYRATMADVNSFKPKDYVTLSYKFAKGHAQHNVAIEEAPSHVLSARVLATDVYQAYNPDEWFYDGTEIEGKVIWVEK